ncbi:MAG TPA: 3-hydroxyacyl-CoA dehydrogenase NAD-binding domain-containing protein [Candidatus Angelobacter sp.]
MAEVQTIAVIGAGAVGQEIARLAALGGFSTILEDILPASLRRARNEIRTALDEAISRGAMNATTAEGALIRIAYASSVDQAARAADLIIEAVPDELESKMEILTLLDKVARPATLFATTTRELSVSEISAVTYRAEKTVGLRFPPAIDQKRLLEIVRGEKSDNATVTACAEVGQRMGLKVVVLEDTPRSAAQ